MFENWSNQFCKTGQTSFLNQLSAYIELQLFLQTCSEWSNQKYCQLKRRKNRSSQFCKTGQTSFQKLLFQLSDQIELQFFFCKLVHNGQIRNIVTKKITGQTSVQKLLSRLLDLRHSFFFFQISTQPRQSWSYFLFVLGYISTPMI